MKRLTTAAYAVFSTILLGGGFVTAFAFAWSAGLTETLFCLLGLLTGLILSPVLHEIGHLFFAKVTDMEWIYAKFFCFKLYRSAGKKRFGLASPFAADMTQVTPRSGGDMQKRASLYTLGGLIFGGVFLLVVVTAAILTTVFGETQYFLWGILPYAAYLFFLNLAPLTYASGKTDALVYAGIRKDEPTERVMLSAMEIQGRLFAGESFGQIEEKLYFDLPQLCEDEPLFHVILDLRYRYYLEKGETEKAFDCLDRLLQAQAYLSDEEREKLAAELVYLHASFGNREGAESYGKGCRNYLAQEGITQKRILAAYAAAFGSAENARLLIAQAEQAEEKELFQGVVKFERILLSRISLE